MSGPDFAAFLNGFTIAAFDLSFAASVGGVHIGTASGLVDHDLLTPST
jgi:hypothetical protein